MLLRAGRREVDVVADPLLLAVVTGGDGVDGAMLSSAAIPTIRILHQSGREAASCRGVC